jgi:hypothetical protein
MKKTNRREFIRMTAISGVGLGLGNSFPTVYANTPASMKSVSVVSLINQPDIPFIPNRVASWWCTLEDIQWSQKKIVDKIKRRAAGFAEAKIDTAINFGFHVRFDFSNYFGQLHGYCANVCDELHKYGIKFMDHYSCNHVERPRGEAEFRKLNKIQRHHTLLFHDPQAARYAQYEDHFFNDICQVNLSNGSRGYSPIYQFETFCHNNPGYLDMHTKYLKRQIKEVPFDGFQVDDMCDYAGLTVCGCKYCRERLRRDYGHEIPSFSDKLFWGTIKNEFEGGNYENPAFRDWIRMRADSVADHVKLVKSIIGVKPLMTCVSSSGPIRLNALALNLERMASHLDFFMLENVGTNVNSVNWVRMDAEALHQKDIAEKRGNAPAMAISYTIYEKGGYLGWSLSRFWGVANWSSTLNGRLEEDPEDAMETHDIIRPYNNWELNNSNLNYRDGKDLVEVRLVNSSYCRDNGWRDTDGLEQWDRVKAWSAHFVENNVGYRFVRSKELSDDAALSKENTPLILDGVACVSESQLKAIKKYLSIDGTVWFALPFGTHDEKGFKRDIPLSQELINNNYKNLVVIESAVKANPLQKLISQNQFKPVLRKVSGDKRWAARIRIYPDNPVIHFMNTAIVAIPHPTLKDASGISILNDIGSKIENNDLQYEIDTNRISLFKLSILSPELGEEKREVDIHQTKNGYSALHVNLTGVTAYAVAQKVK